MTGRQGLSRSRFVFALLRHSASTFTLANRSGVAVTRRVGRMWSGELSLVQELPVDGSRTADGQGVDVVYRHTHTHTHTHIHTYGVLFAFL